MTRPPGRNLRPRDDRADDGCAVALRDVEVCVPACLPAKRLVVEEPDVEARTGRRLRRENRREDGEQEREPLQEPSLRSRP